MSRHTRSTARNDVDAVDAVDAVATVACTPSAVSKTLYQTPVCGRYQTRTATLKRKNVEPRIEDAKYRREYNPRAMEVTNVTLHTVVSARSQLDQLDKLYYLSSDGRTQLLD